MALFCGTAHSACERISLPVRALERNALVCAQPSAKPGAPAVLAFHGRGGNAREMAGGTRLHEAWPEAVVVYLDGLSGNPAPYDPKGERAGWQINPGDLNDRDVAFTDAVLDALDRHYHVDRTRLFAVGHSNGARFVGVLWVQLPHRFAALAFSAAQADSLIAAAEPVPVFMAMGIRDEVVPFEWQRQSLKYAAARFGAVAFEDGREGVHSVRNSSGIELVSYIHPGRHGWPAGQSAMIIEFFKRHSLRPAGEAGQRAPQADRSSP